MCRRLYPVRQWVSKRSEDAHLPSGEDWGLGEAQFKKMFAAVHYRKEQIITKKNLEETKNKKVTKPGKYFTKGIYFQKPLKAVQKKNKQPKCVNFVCFIYTTDFPQSGYQKITWRLFCKQFPRCFPQPKKKATTKSEEALFERFFSLFFRQISPEF